MAVQSVTFGIRESDVVGLTEPQRVSEELTAALSIVSEGTLVYKNLTYPRFQNFYGRCQLMSGAYVVQNVQLQHINQELLHWRNTELGINATTLCLLKLYGSLDTPPIALTVFNVLTRSRFTSLRFRLPAGTLANLTLQWNDYDAKCGEEVRQPSPTQGQPASPANSGYNPGSRPGAQGGDPFDNSPNDGRATGPGEVAPPAPSGPGASATWKIALQFFSNPPACTPSSSVYNTGIGDPAAQITAFTEDVTPQENGCGTTVKRLKASSNGVDLNVPPDVRAPGTAVVGISFY